MVFRNACTANTFIHRAGFLSEKKASGAQRFKNSTFRGMTQGKPLHGGKQMS